MKSIEKPRIIPRSEHIVSRRHIEPEALKVVKRLNQKGYKAYIVGGGVRDLLLQKKPKDFDVATEAKPREVKKLFRNCWLIGRRFRLAHIKFGTKGQKIVEVSTFRSPPEADEDGQGVPMLADDNVFGTPQEDAYRRDFTINALFYCAKDYTLIDYVGGYRDLQKGVIRSIGDPRVRYQEDPVRMLRAIKFAGRLDFSLNRSDHEAIQELFELISQVSQSRLTVELYKLFETPGMLPIFDMLCHYQLLPSFAPGLPKLVTSSRGQQVLAQLDQLRLEDQPLEPPQILAALIEAQYRSFKMFPKEPQLIWRQKVEKALENIKISRRDRDALLRILMVLSRVSGVRGVNPRAKILSQPQFAMALKLWELREARHPEDPGRLERWREAFERFQKNPKPKTVQRRKKRPKKKSSE